MEWTLAFRAFFRVLQDTSFAAQTAQLLEGKASKQKLPAPKKQPTPAPTPKATTPPKPKPPARSEAVTLLAALQREGRLVDFLQESMSGFSDAQIGAVARDMHKGCAEVVERMFGLKPVCDQEEESVVNLPKGFDAGRYRLTGKVAGEPPFKVHLAHHGWEATRCELPAWTGTDSAAKVVAPAEVELR